MKAVGRRLWQRVFLVFVFLAICKQTQVFVKQTMLFVPIGAGAPDIGFLLRRRGAVGTGDVGLLFGLRLHLALLLSLGALPPLLECDTFKDDLVDVISAISVIHIISF